jgi:hypothetical protein
MAKRKNGGSRKGNGPNAKRSNMMKKREAKQAKKLGIVDMTNKKDIL